MSQPEEGLALPTPRFATEGQDAYHSSTSSSSRTNSRKSSTLELHSRNSSTNLDGYPRGTSTGDSPLPTPRILTFGLPSTPNAFATPSSFRSMSPVGDGSNGGYPFPDVVRSSRPTTADAMPGSPRHSSMRSRDPFASPAVRPLTLTSSTPAPSIKHRDRTKSTMLDRDAPLTKPWISKRDPFATVSYILTYGFILFGLAAGAIRCFFGWHDVALMSGNLCPILDQDFTNGENGVFGDGGTFLREVDLSGYGNGEFQMTTASSNNSFVRDGMLYILPTLTSDQLGISAILNGSIYNATDCTFNLTQGMDYADSSKTTGTNSSIISDGVHFDADAYYKACSAVSNDTTGQVINPVQSARLSTRGRASIRYGKVEIRAKLPTGDWMWPSLWMMPVDNTYGAWPLSGEIDIMESRGNGPDYPDQGSNYVRGSLNWGPVTWLNSVYLTYGWWTTRRGSYANDFHTYSLEWTEDFIRIYVDTRLHHLLDLRIKDSFWDVGNFPPVVQNGSETVALQNPWVNGTKAAPFDQPFYLIMGVGIGGTNGWFPDGDGKPWLDGSFSAARDFIAARDKWLPTWPTNTDDRAFVIDYVKMWQQC